MTEAAPALDRVVKALYHYDSTIRAACQAAVSDFSVHFSAPAFFVQIAFPICRSSISSKRPGCSARSMSAVIDFPFPLV